MFLVYIAIQKPLEIAEYKVKILRSDENCSHNMIIIFLGNMSKFNANAEFNKVNFTG